MSLLTGLHSSSPSFRLGYFFQSVPFSPSLSFEQWRAPHLLSILGVILVFVCVGIHTQWRRMLKASRRGVQPRKQRPHTRLSRAECGILQEWPVQSLELKCDSWTLSPITQTEMKTNAGHWRPGKWIHPLCVERGGVE